LLAEVPVDANGNYSAEVSKAAFVTADGSTAFAEIDSNIGLHSILEVNELASESGVATVDLNLAQTLGYLLFQNQTETGDTTGGHDFTAIPTDYNPACYTNVLGTMANYSEANQNPTLGGSLRSLMNLYAIQIASGNWTNNYTRLDDMMNAFITASASEDFFDQAVAETIAATNSSTVKNDLYLFISSAADLGAAMGTALVDSDAADVDALSIADICESPTTTVDVAKTFLNFNPDTFIETFEMPNAQAYLLQNLNDFYNSTTGEMDGFKPQILAGLMQVSDFDLNGEHADNDMAKYLATLALPADADLTSFTRSFLSMCHASDNCSATQISQEQNIATGVLIALHATGLSFDLPHRDETSLTTFDNNMNGIFENGKTLTNIGLIIPDYCQHSPQECYVPVTALLANTTIAGQTTYQGQTYTPSIANTIEAARFLTAQPVYASDATHTFLFDSNTPGGATYTKVHLTVNYQAMSKVTTVSCGFEIINDNDEIHVTKIVMVASGTSAHADLNVPNGIAGVLSCYIDFNGDGEQTDEDLTGYYLSNNGAIPLTPNFTGSEAHPEISATINMFTFGSTLTPPPPSGNSIAFHINLGGGLGLVNGTTYAYKIFIDNDNILSNGNTAFSGTFVYNNTTNYIAAPGGGDIVINNIASGPRYVVGLVDLGTPGPNTGDPIGWMGGTTSPPGSPSFNIPSSGNVTITFGINGLMPAPAGNSISFHINLGGGLGLVNGNTYPYKIFVDPDNDLTNGGTITFNGTFVYDNTMPFIKAPGGGDVVINGVPSGQKFIAAMVDYGTVGLNTGDPFGWMGTNSTTAPMMASPSANVPGSGTANFSFGINGLQP
jgi:hypothetical protein